MEDRFRTRQIIDDNNKVITLACTGRKDKNGELVYEGDTIVFTLPNNDIIGKGHVVYRDDLLTYFVENGELEEELWAVNIIKVVD